MIQKYPIFDEKGIIFGVATIATEITETKKKTDNLNLALSAYDLGSEAIMVIDQNYDIALINQNFTRITGYTEKDVSGKNPRILSSGRHESSFFKDMYSQIQSVGFWEGEIWNRRKDNSVFPCDMVIRRIAAPNGKGSYFLSVFSDITNKKSTEEEIVNLAYYDTLTGLPNRYLLRDRAEKLIQRCSRENTYFALVFFDLDKFKNVNDVFGHDAGDAMLREIAKRVTSKIRETDTLCRLGGDEFVMLLDDIQIANLASRLEVLHKKIEEKVEFKGNALSVSASFGIALYPHDGHNYDTLLKNADTAMFAAKNNKREFYAFFEDKMTETVRRQLAIESGLKQALDNNEFSVVYQPQVNLADGKICGAEALIRWHSKALGKIGPDIFIPIAEQYGLIERIGEWVLKEALFTLSEINQRDANFKMAINVSAYQLETNRLVERLKTLLDNSQITANNVELELTESAVMRNPDDAKKVLNEIKALGCRLSLDDFGIGYSSMAYLKALQFDLIKIDKSFTLALGSNTDDAENNQIICNSIIGLAHNLGIKALAEGVETKACSEYLSQNACDFVQGFYYSHPLSKKDLLDKLIQ